MNITTLIINIIITTVMILTKTDERYLALAAEVSKQSPVLMRHGAVAVVSGKVMAKGYNNYRTTSSDGFISNTCTCHAEVDVIRKLYHTSMTNAYGKHSSNIKVV